MGEIINLDEIRALKAAEAKAEEEKKLADERSQKLEELEYSKSVLETMVGSFPAASGAFYMPMDSNYLYEGSTTMYYPPEEDIALSDQIYFDYDSGWASEDDEDV